MEAGSGGVTGLRPWESGWNVALRHLLLPMSGLASADRVLQVIDYYYTVGTRSSRHSLNPPTAEAHRKGMVGKDTVANVAAIIDTYLNLGLRTHFYSVPSG